MGVLCTGVDDIAVLYCSYSVRCVPLASLTSFRLFFFQLLEILGVRFRIDADIVPSIGKEFENLDDFLMQKLRGIDMKITPKFSLRGNQPFHDFAEGPDWWDETDYKLLFDQMGKMKMNFIGLHTYPVSEPTVWTGLDGEFDPVTGVSLLLAMFFLRLLFLGSARQRASIVSNKFYEHSWMGWTASVKR